MPYQDSAQRAMLRLTSTVAGVSRTSKGKWAYVLQTHRDAVPEVGLLLTPVALLAQADTECLALYLSIGTELMVKHPMFKDDLLRNKFYHLWIFGSLRVVLVVSEFVLTADDLTFLLLHGARHFGIEGRDHFLLDALLTEQQNPVVQIGQSHCRVFLHPNPRSPVPFRATGYPIMAPMIWDDPHWLQGLARWAYDQCLLSQPDFCQLLILIEEDIHEITVCVFKLAMHRWMRDRRKWCTGSYHIMCVETSPHVGLQRHLCATVSLRAFWTSHWQRVCTGMTGMTAPV